MKTIKDMLTKIGVLKADKGPLGGLAKAAKKQGKTTFKANVTLQAFKHVDLDAQKLDAPTPLSSAQVPQSSTQITKTTTTMEKIEQLKDRARRNKKGLSLFLLLILGAIVGGVVAAMGPVAASNQGTRSPTGGGGGRLPPITNNNSTASPSMPIITKQPTVFKPTTSQPTFQTTPSPTAQNPTRQPTAATTVAQTTAKPTSKPTSKPTNKPTADVGTSVNSKVSFGTFQTNVQQYSDGSVFLEVNSATQYLPNEYKAKGIPLVVDTQNAGGYQVAPSFPFQNLYNNYGDAFITALTADMGQRGVTGLNAQAAPEPVVHAFNSNLRGSTNAPAREKTEEPLDNNKNKTGKKSGPSN